MQLLTVHLFILGALLPHVVYCVEITRFVVPSVTSIGSIIELDCAYDLQGDQLYSVTWYKDDKEFFRCKSSGEVQPFHVNNIRILLIERATLGSCHVTLTTIGSKGFSSDFSCEVSAEGPQFKTTSRTEHVRVKENNNSKPLGRTQEIAREEERRSPTITTEKVIGETDEDQSNKSSTCCINAYLHIIVFSCLLYAI